MEPTELSPELLIMEPGPAGVSLPRLAYVNVIFYFFTSQSRTACLLKEQ